MKVLINLFCDRVADAGDALDLGEPGARHRSGRTEMVQQGMLALGADPGDLIERRLADRPGALGAMRTDRETVRLVAQPLNEVEDGIARFDREGRAPAQAALLPPAFELGDLRTIGHPPH